MDEQVLAAVARIPGWPPAVDLQLEPLVGLTNRNYLVTIDGERFVLRLAGRDSGLLGVDRRAEREALMRAADAGIGAPLVHFLLPEGHLVTRFLAGRRWTPEEYRDPVNLRRLVAAVQRVHAFPLISNCVSPFRWVEQRLAILEELELPLPEDLHALLDAMREIEAGQLRASHTVRGLCHNDLFFVNLLDDGGVRIVDWEFAGMGDVYFDLATLVYGYGADRPLPPELEEELLALYFGEATAGMRQHLQGMKFMVLLRDAVWGLVQHALNLQQDDPSPDFNYLSYAENLIAIMKRTF